MASEKGTVASGADYEQATRRRNVASTSPNGGIVDRIEIDDKKTRVVRKVGWVLFQDLGRMADVFRMSNHCFNSLTSGSSSSRLSSSQLLRSSQDYTRLACLP